MAKKPKLPDTLTVVFQIRDKEKFHKKFGNLSRFMTRQHIDGKDSPFAITGLSIADELTRSSLISEAIDRGGHGLDLHETITEILALTTPQDFDKFRFYEYGKKVKPGKGIMAAPKQRRDRPARR